MARRTYMEANLRVSTGPPARVSPLTMSTGTTGDERAYMSIAQPHGVALNQKRSRLSVAGGTSPETGEALAGEAAGFRGGMRQGRSDKWTRDTGEGPLFLETGARIVTVGEARSWDDAIGRCTRVPRFDGGGQDYSVYARPSLRFGRGHVFGAFELLGGLAGIVMTHDPGSYGDGTPEINYRITSECGVIPREKTSMLERAITTPVAGLDADNDGYCSQGTYCILGHWTDAICAVAIVRREVEFEAYVFGARDTGVSYLPCMTGHNQSGKLLHAMKRLLCGWCG